MAQEMFPEIETAMEALQSRIRLTETEIAEMKKDLKAKKQLVRSWRKALAAFAPQPAVVKKKPALAG